MVKARELPRKPDTTLRVVSGIAPRIYGAAATTVLVLSEMVSRLRFGQAYDAPVLSALTSGSCHPLVWCCPFGVLI